MTQKRLTDYDPREERAREDVEAITRSGDLWLVMSASGEHYHVDLDEETCDCPDHEYRGAKCKHIRAVEQHAAEDDTPAAEVVDVQRSGDGRVDVVVEYEDDRGRTRTTTAKADPGGDGEWDVWTADHVPDDVHLVAEEYAASHDLEAELPSLIEEMEPIEAVDAADVIHTSHHHGLIDIAVGTDDGQSREICTVQRVHAPDRGGLPVSAISSDLAPLLDQFDADGETLRESITRVPVEVQRAAVDAADELTWVSPAEIGERVELFDGAGTVERHATRGGDDAVVATHRGDDARRLWREYVAEDCDTETTSVSEGFDREFFVDGEVVARVEARMYREVQWWESYADIEIKPPAVVYECADGSYTGFGRDGHEEFTYFFPVEGE
ncbi:hypothetical protein J2754_001573 [Halarchaeum solikamskense]|uniref:SWIM zinc finger family protein n=1 Tax=Halarchaeum nitratireducens TaxID=489913 RepID=UPI001B3A9B73|nr:SWIM zinc finger family protein [Halarchaeum solikamskense]MBP2251252.1 hypothetical protein [Halarchaeum solikamskense]